MMYHRAFLIGLVACSLPACSSIGVRRAKDRALFADIRASSISADKPSPRTMQTLRRLDLDQRYDVAPDSARQLLHDEAVRDPQPDTLFALAEVHYLGGRAIEKKKPDEATGHYVRCCGYAQQFLFATCADDGADPAAMNPAARLCDSLSCVPPVLTPRDAFDPRFRIACTLYNDGLTRCLRVAQKTGRFDSRRELVLPRADGGVDRLPVVQTGFAWQPADFGLFYFTEDYDVVGLANEYRTYGLGVPLIGTLSPAAKASPYYARGLSFPVTALLRLDGGLAGMDRPIGRLELYNPRSVQAVALAGHTIPLETDLTTPLAHTLERSPADKLALVGFFNADRVRGEAGIRMVEPYQPGKIPILLVHGLLSTPATWAPLYNDLQADPLIREKYQFWFYFYPTSDPYLATAADLRQQLLKLRADLDPEGRDPALNDLVLVGHSMGGLISKLLTIDGGDDFWSLVSNQPLADVRARPDVRSELQQVFYFERTPIVKRVVFLATPHHGSKLSPSFLAQKALRFVQLPKTLMAAADDLTKENPNLTVRQLPTSVDLLAPNAPALELLASRPRPAGVHYHSVVGVAPTNDAVIERWLAGDRKEPGDGVVPYTSAHLETAETELPVPADHFHVHQHPLAVREVRRILLEHAEAARRGSEVITATAHAP
jgi:pimeloyl-ACP methyl ester carboxylesterase